MELENAVVKYSNQFNTIALERFRPLHHDLFMAIASRLRDKHTTKVSISFADLEREVRMDSRHESVEQFVETLDQVNKGLAAMSVRFDVDEKIVRFTLFQTFTIDRREKMLTVSVHPDFTFLLNDLTSNFTRFELSEFMRLKSAYAKEVYRRCKQYRTTGVWRVSREEFARLLGLPASYSKSTKDLKKRVLEPVEAELGPIIGLHVEYVYSRPKGERRPGRKPLTGFAFHFRTEVPPLPSAQGAKKRKGGSKPQEQPTMKDDSPAQLEDVMKDAEAREEKRKRDLGRAALAIYNREHGTNLSVRDAGWDPAVKAELAELEKIIALQAVGAE